MVKPMPFERESPPPPPSFRGADQASPIRGRSPVTTLEIVVVAALMAVLLSVRLAFLEADTPLEVQFHHLTDEGWWSQNARNHALFGRWIMDDHNPGLLAAPLYTLLLRAMYALTGPGLWSTRALAALCGWGTCVLVYFMTRKDNGWRTASIATLVIGLNFFMLTHNRVAFVESTQLFFLTAALLATVRASDHALWGIAGGALFAAAIGAKLSAIPMLVIPALYWGLHWWDARTGRTASAFRLASPIGFGLALGVVAGITLLFFVPPYAELVLAEMQNSMAINSMGQTRPWVTAVGMLGLYSRTLEPNGFLVLNAGLVGCCAAMAVQRCITHTDRRRTPTDRMMLCWLLGGVVVLVTQAYQPDRRFLFLLPPLAMFIAPAIRGGGIRFAARGNPEWGGHRWWCVAAGLPLALLAGLYFRALLIEPIMNLTQGMNWGEHPGLSPAAAGCAAWMALALLGVGGGVLLIRWWPRRTLRVPGLLVLGVCLAPDIARTALRAREITFTCRDAMCEIGALTDTLSANQRVATGELAHTFLMESTVFAYVTRRWDYARVSLNLDGWERFDPYMVFIQRGFDPLPGFNNQRFEHWQSFPICPDSSGSPRFHLDVYFKSLSE